MHTLWHKVFADIRLNKSRSLLAAISIAVGVFCVGALFGMIDLQLSKMDAAHRQSEPSHINLILRQQADKSLLAKITELPGVAAVDVMTPVSMNFRRSGASDWVTGTVIVRPDYARQVYDRTTLVAGAWPQANQLALENLSAVASGLTTGDSLEVKTDKGVRTMAIKGVVRHPFVKPPKFGGQIHFFAAAADADMFDLPDNGFRQLLVQIESPYSVDKARRVATELRGFLASQHLDVSVTLLQDPDQHWGRSFLAGINGVLQIMALVSLVLASTLILNTMAAHIAQQTQQIGVMKALGAKSRTVAAVYLGETLVLALVAIILALPLALAVAYFSSCHLLALFNIDCGAFSYSHAALLWMLVGGVSAPLIAVLLPVWRGASMNVRAALSSYGLGGHFGLSRFDLWLERWGARFLPTLYVAALGNLFRRKVRFVLTQSVLVSAGVTFLVLMSLWTSVSLTLDNEMARSRFAVRLGFAQDQNAEDVAKIAHTVAGTESVEIWQRLPLELFKNGETLRQKGSLGLQLLALPSNSNLYQPLIEAGRWLLPDDAGRRVLVISADTAALNAIQVGEFLETKIGAQAESWQVIGIYRWLAGSNYAVEPLYAPQEALPGMAQRKNRASLILLNAATENLKDEMTYLAALKQRFQDSGIKLDAYNMLAKLEQRQFAKNQFKPVLATLLGLASMIAVVGGIGLSGILAISVQQRTREIGVLRAIGAPGKAVFRLFLFEGLLHGLIAWFLSVPLAYFAAEPIAERLGLTMLGMRLDFEFDVCATVEWLCILMMLVFLASYWPARKAASQTVKQSLGHA